MIDTHLNKSRECPLLFIPAIMKTHADAKMELISTQWQAIPYLSPKENLFLGVQKKHFDPAYLDSLYQQFDVKTAFMKKNEELTPFEAVKLQFLHELLLHKKKIAFDDVCASFSITETQAFLALCKQITQQEQLSISIYTSDPALTKLDGKAI